MSKVKERPIIFSGDQVRAILDGQKTSTRRTLKWQPLDVIKGKVIDGAQTWVTLDTRDPNHGSIIKCRHGEIGDHLWVKETWCPVHDSEFGEEDWVDYRATPRYANPGVSHPAGWENAPDDPEALKWRSSRFMPRWASRILLEITDVRVERLQDISLNDCKAEGIPQFSFARGALSDTPPDPRWKFIELWDEINAKSGYPWASNSWVWVIEFKRIEP